MEQTLSYKVLITGDGAIGKSTFLHRLITGEFSELTMTKGHDFVVYNTNQGEIPITIVFWDLGGQRQYQPLHKAYLKGAKAVIYAFDISRITSIGSVLFWNKFITENMPTKPLNFLLGLKSDLGMRANFFQEKIDEVFREIPFTKYWFASAKSNLNIKESISELVETLVQELK